MYKYGHLEEVSAKNFEGLVELALKLKAYDAQIIMLKDNDDKQRYLILSSSEALEKDGTLKKENLTIIWSEKVSECLEKLKNGYYPDDIY